MSVSRVAPRLRCLRPLVQSSGRPFSTTPAARREEEWPQRMPIGAFYESILNAPTPYPFDQKPEEPPNTADPEVLPETKKPVATEKKEPEAPTPDDRPAKRKPGRPRKTTTASATEAAATSSPPASQNTSPPSPSPPPSSAEEKARIIFGTRLASPDDKAARLAKKESEASYIAGVLVPPKPEEPDNCCMSGCVNCVWDLFREDMEEYTAKRVEAEKRLAQSSESMEDDGGGSETNWTPEAAAAPPQGVQVGDAKIAKDMWDEDLFQNVPVGIREFMKQEKKLKERHEREGTSGG